MVIFDGRLKKNVIAFSGNLGEAMLLSNQSRGGITFGVSSQIYKYLVNRK